MSTTLTAPETREFARLEAIIESGLDGFVKVGNALAKIRDAGLYRANHATFDAYCRDRWKIAKSRAYQLIAAATTVEAMSTVVDVEPTSERQVRPLTKLPEAERAEAWQAAVDADPSGPTAETVGAIVAERLGAYADELEQTEPTVADRIATALEEPLPDESTPAPKIVPDSTRDRFLALWNSTGRLGRILIRQLALDWPETGDAE